MKRRVLFFSILLIIAHQGLSQATSSFHINGQISSLKSTAKVTLTLRENNQWAEYPTEVKAGKFVITGKVDEPSFAYLVLKYGNELDRGPRPGNILELFVNNSIIEVKTKDSLINSSVSGSPVQADFISYQKSIQEWKSKSSSLRSNEEKAKVIAGFIKQHPQSSVNLFAIQNLSLDGSFTLNPSEAQPLFDLLSPELKATSTGKSLEKDIAIARNTSMGAIAPGFTQADTSNVPINLTTFRGQYVLIDFWASWCKPCRAENPELVKTFKEFKDRNFTIVSVSLDSNGKSWKKAIVKDQLAWTHVSDLRFWKNEVAQLYGVKTVPQNFLIDPNGKIIAAGIKAADLKKVLSGYIQ